MESEIFSIVCLIDRYPLMGDEVKKNDFFSLLPFETIELKTI